MSDKYLGFIDDFSGCFGYFDTFFTDVFLPTYTVHLYLGDGGRQHIQCHILGMIKNEPDCPLIIFVPFETEEESNDNSLAVEHNGINIIRLDSLLEHGFRVEAPHFEN